MDGFNMLLDVLAVIIGFSAVMLLLSLIVTAMVQATQNLYQMRSTNLRDGLEMVIGQTVKTVNAPEMAAAVLEAASLPQAKSTLGRIVDMLAPRARTWIEPDEISEYLREAAKGLTDAQVEEVVRRFQRSEKLMTMRFVGRIRVVTLLWALLVPFWFQVDSLALLRNLSLQPELRAAAVALGSQIVGEAEETQRVLAGYEDVSELALAQLADRHPDLAEQIEEAAGIGSDQTVLQELNAVLAGAPAVERQMLLTEYQNLLDELRLAAVRDSAARAGSAARYLGAFNIQPWWAGGAFYFSLSNWLGVLITTLALMLGAPFWFNVLKSAVGLRDTLKPVKRDKESAGA